MKITKRQIRKIIREEKSRVLKESVADDRGFEVLIQSVAADVAELYEAMMGAEFFDEDPAMFDGRSTRDEWVAQVTIASMELEQQIEAAIRRTIEGNENLLHDGNFQRG